MLASVQRVSRQPASLNPGWCCPCRKVPEVSILLCLRFVSISTAVECRSLSPSCRRTLSSRVVCTRMFIVCFLELDHAHPEKVLLMYGRGEMDGLRVGGKGELIRVFVS